MIEITFQRKRCTGCNTCVELNSNNWRMDWMDDKSILIGSERSNGVYKLQLENDNFELHKSVADSCPERIIAVKKV